MKKHWKKTVACLMAMTVSCAVLASCGESENDQGDLSYTDKTYDLGYVLHEVDVQATNTVFTDDGRSDYVIVYPEGGLANGYIQNAVTELQLFVKQATGVNLPIKSDTQMTGQDKILSVGNTVQSRQFAKLQDKMRTVDLKEQGFFVLSDNSSVYMKGKNELASMYAVYEFLKHQFHFETYSYDEVYGRLFAQVDET